MAKANIINHNGYPAICIDGNVYPPMTATVVTGRVPLGETGRTVDADYYKSLGDAGIKIFYIMCNNLEADPNGVADFANEVQQLLSVVPDAYVMVRMVLNPSEKWLKENPDQLMQYNDGKRIPCDIRTESYLVHSEGGMLALCSQKWRDDYGKVLERTMAEIEKQPFYDRIIGYFLGGGCNAEWFSATPTYIYDQGLYGDFSEAFREEFQKYLDETYGKGVKKADIPDLESRYLYTELDKEFDKPKVRPLAAHPAPKPTQFPSMHGTFLNMDTHRQTYDFYRAYGLGNANSIIHFAKIVKNRHPDLLTGSFYGGVSYDTCTTNSAGGVMRVLQSGVVDFLANPGMYENRQPGGFTGQRQANDSFRLHNAMFISEDDTRTHAENLYYGNYYEMFTPEDTINVLKRDFGRNICDDLQSWWYDQHIGGGRYKFPEVYELFAKQQKIGHLAYALDRTKGNEVAFISDEESMYMAHSKATERSLLDFRNYEIANLGFGADSYIHNDLSHPDMPDYKLYVFLNCFSLTDKEREDIRKKLQKNHATALFLYGNGYINPDRTPSMHADYMQELTGICMEEEMEKYAPKFKITDNDVFKNLDKGKWYGEFDKLRKPNQDFAPYYVWRTYLYPLLYANDQKATELAKYAQVDRSAVVVKEADGFTSVYCGTKFISAEVVREIARFAGCHIYENDGHVLYVNKNFATIHASHSGTITLKFPQECSPFELYEEKYYGKDTKEISFDLLKGETRMFRLEK